MSPVCSHVKKALFHVDSLSPRQLSLQKTGIHEDKSTRPKDNLILWNLLKTNLFKLESLVESCLRLTCQFLRSSERPPARLTMISCPSPSPRLYNTWANTNGRGWAANTKELEEGVRAGGHPEVWPGCVVEVQHLSLLLRPQVGQPQRAHVVVLARHEIDVGDGQLHRLAGHRLSCRGRPVLMALQGPLLNHSAMLNNDQHLFTEQQSSTCSAWWLLDSFVARPCSKSVLWWPEMNFVIKAHIHPQVSLPVEAPVWVYMIGQPRYMWEARRWYSPCWPPREKVRVWICHVGRDKHVWSFGQLENRGHQGYWSFVQY